MKIALDFDGTFTVDPNLWLDFINSAESSGHQVFIVTARDGLNDGIDWSKVYLFRMGDGRRIGMQGPPCRVIWCDGREKRKVVREHGVQISVWIDDNPYGIVSSTSFSGPEQLAAWRAQDEYRGSKLPVTGESRGFEGREASDERNIANGPQNPQGSPDHNRGHRLLSRRPRGGSGSVAEG